MINPDGFSHRLLDFRGKKKKKKSAVMILTCRYNFHQRIQTGTPTNTNRNVSGFWRYKTEVFLLAVEPAGLLDNYDTSGPGMKSAFPSTNTKYMKTSLYMYILEILRSGFLSRYWLPISRHHDRQIQIPIVQALHKSYVSFLLTVTVNLPRHRIAIGPWDRDKFRDNRSSRRTWLSSDTDWRTIDP